MKRESWAGTILEGERVALRPMTEEDAEAVVRWRNNPEIRRWLFSRDPLTVESHLKWFQRSKPDRVDYVVCLKKTGRPVGTVSFTRIDPAAGRAEAGKMLGEPALWGKGLMGEAFRIWMAFGFERIGLSYIYVRMKASNERNIRLNTRIGFRRERVVRGEDLEDVLVMGLDRDEAVRRGIIAAGTTGGVR